MPAEGVDVLVGSLSTSLASVGGFCVGSPEVVDHQVLSGAGYCYSASAPPFLMHCASVALDELSENTEVLEKLDENVRFVYEGIGKMSGVRVVSAPESPLIFVAVGDVERYEYDLENLEDATNLLRSLHEVCNALLRDGVLAIVDGRGVEQMSEHAAKMRKQAARKKYGKAGNDSEGADCKFTPPMIRLSISASHTRRSLQRILDSLQTALGSLTTQG